MGLSELKDSVFRSSPSSCRNPKPLDTNNSQRDVTALWGCRSEEIKILGLDLGQACVVGASALLPEEPKEAELKKAQRDQDGGIVAKEPCNDTKPVPGLATYYNLAAAQKAVYQPILKYRRWLEECKRIVLPGATESISDIESGLPPLCGDDAIFAKYVTELGNAKEQSHSFYNHSMVVKKHRWDAKEAQEAEYAIIMNCLLKMVGVQLAERGTKGTRS
ncbi:hypothetical protein BGZ54_003818 [Gamsiella multidivaricata]|nr:hypothetical protein BGZ54_003818 [Gamsiella multidivaricata]